MGNHDCFRSGYVYNSPLDIISEVDLDNVSVYKDINTVFIGSTAFTFLPFRDRKSFNVSVNTEAIAMLRDSLVYELASIPVTYKKVLVGHLAIEGSIPVGDEIDDIANELFCPLEMFKGYDYVWMGHVHKPQVMQKKNPYIAHTGSMDLSNFGESDHKKHIIIVECDGVDKDFIMENLPTRPLRKINIVVPKDTDDTTAYVLKAIKDLKEDFGKAIVKVEVSLSTPELKSVSKSAVDKYLTEQGAFSVASISESKKLNIVKKDSNNTIDTKMDVTSAIKTYAHTYVDDKIRLKFIEFAMQIVADHKAEAKE
jgi:DNA repair exonuclease SbcCD nuclease subunit